MAIKTSRIIKWAGIEFQPDLLKPKRPVRLGTILVEKIDDSSHSIVIFGRAPVFESRPSEFEGVGDITMKIVSNWTESMLKDILEAGDADIFDRLASRWKWNLYIVEPKLMKASEKQGSVEAIAKKTYEKFVREPFEKRTVSAKAKNKAAVPLARPSSAWQREELKRRKVGESLSAVALG